MVLIVVFVAVLLYNALYFTGVVGDFGGDTELGPLPQDPSLTPPGFEQQGAAPTQRPVPSAPRAQARPVERRGEITAADLTMDTSWGRNPFFTPREIWALDNFAPVYTDASVALDEGLYLSAIVTDSTGRRVAVINNDIVTVGDHVAGLQVVEVTEETVVFAAGGQRHVLRMADAAIGLSSRSGTVGRY
jgi:hypothetical protein